MAFTNYLLQRLIFGWIFLAMDWGILAGLAQPKRLCDLWSMSFSSFVVSGGFVVVDSGRLSGFGAH
jgi:uncharacterized membrane protein YeiB